MKARVFGNTSDAGVTGKNAPGRHTMDDPENPPILDYATPPPSPNLRAPGITLLSLICFALGALCSGVSAGVLISNAFNGHFTGAAICPLAAGIFFCIRSYRLQRR
jgi:hypothetical protein